MLHIVGGLKVIPCTWYQVFTRTSYILLITTGMPCWPLSSVAALLSRLRLIGPAYHQRQNPFTCDVADFSKFELKKCRKHLFFSPPIFLFSGLKEETFFFFFFLKAEIPPVPFRFCLTQKSGKSEPTKAQPSTIPTYIRYIISHIIPGNVPGFPQARYTW